MSDSDGNGSAEKSVEPESGNKLNLDQFANAHKWDLKVSQEHADERASRLRREERNQSRDIITGYIKLGCLLLALVGVAAIAGYVLIGKTNASDDERRWAMSVLMALITGAVGYVAGEKAGQSKARE